MDGTKFRGTGVAMVTPFFDDPNNGVDLQNIERLLEHLIAGGIDFLVIQGTTGETATLLEYERKTIVHTIHELNRGRIPLVLGISGNHTQRVADDIKKAEDWKMDGILSANPAYNKPNQRGQYQHYAALAGATSLPILLYNVPGRTATNMTAETTLSLARNFDNIVGIKEASADFNQCMDILTHRPEGFVVLSGEDALALPLVSLGMDGVISVTANAFPHHFSGMIREALKGNFGSARKKHYRLLPFMRLAFMDGNPAGIKWILRQLGYGQNALRLPLVEVNDQTKAAVATAMQNDPQID